MKYLVILSGGMDSSALLGKFLNHDEVVALTFDYGQSNSPELDAATCVARHFDVPHVTVDLKQSFGAIVQGVSTLTGGVVGNVSDVSSTEVPNRNMVLLSLAGSFALSRGLDVVVYGALGGSEYPDCTDAFITAMEEVFKLCSSKELHLSAPWREMTKAQMVKECAKYQIPWELTWSCYRAGPVHCGECRACAARKDSFRLANINDPTRYEA